MDEEPPSRLAPATAPGPLHVLIYEPAVEGHHVFYLKFVAEDLLSAGYRLTLAIDTRAKPYGRIRAQLGDVLNDVKVVGARDEAGRLVGGGKIASISAMLAQSGADIVFLNNFDAIGSALMRRAAIGLMPPATLRGRLSGIYHRPRFLARTKGSLNLWLKALGFWRLMQNGWFSHLLLVDPYLHADVKAKHPKAPLFFLPDPCPADFVADRAEARRLFGLPGDKRVFLFYGGGYRRKGLHLVIDAMLALPPDTKAFLLCAGQQAHDAVVKAGLDRLIDRGRAKVIDRYVTAKEEKQLFAASDVVLLPYRRHFGISSILIRAVGAGVPVIASDEELLGRLVREQNLGLLFRSGDAVALRCAIDQAANASAEQIAAWRAAMHLRAPSWSQQAAREALVDAFRYVAPPPQYW